MTFCKIDNRKFSPDFFHCLNENSSLNSTKKYVETIEGDGFIIGIEIKLTKFVILKISSLASDKISRRFNLLTEKYIKNQRWSLRTILMALVG